MVPTSAARACAVCSGLRGLGRFGCSTGWVFTDVDAVVGVRGLSCEAALEREDGVGKDGLESGGLGAEEAAVLVLVDWRS